MIIFTDMIAETPNINSLVAKERFVGIQFDKLRMIFSSRFLKHIKMLAAVLESDGISFTIKRRFFLEWELVAEIPVIGKYEDSEYQRIVGKFNLFASHYAISVSMGLIG